MSQGTDLRAWVWAAEGRYTWEVPTLVSLLCAILPKNGAPYVSTNPEYFDRAWLGAEIKAKCLTPH